MVSLSRELRTNPIRLLSTLIAGFTAILAIKKLWAYTGLSHRLFKFLINGNSASLSDISVLTSRLAELIHLGIKPNHAMTIASSALKVIGIAVLARDLPSKWIMIPCGKKAS